MAKANGAGPKLNAMELMEIAEELLTTAPEKSAQLYRLARGMLAAEVDGAREAPGSTPKKRGVQSDPNIGKDERKCPHCGRIGKTATLFGTRKLRDGTTRPQSWCRICRASTDSHPTRGY